MELYALFASFSRHSLAEQPLCKAVVTRANWNSWVELGLLSRGQLCPELIFMGCTWNPTCNPTCTSSSGLVEAIIFILWINSSFAFCSAFSAASLFSSSSSFCLRSCSASIFLHSSSHCCAWRRSSLLCSIMAWNARMQVLTYSWRNMMWLE